MTDPILYIDRDLILCRKPAGMPSQPDPSGQTDLLSLLSRTYPTVKPIHRLDTPTGGVMLFGLSPTATARLCALVQEHERLQKEYLAILPAPPRIPHGELRDHLFHDKRVNKTYVVSTARNGAKEARLTYQTVATAEDGHTLILVRLHTGRTHQIRVQFASRGLPLVGDGKYGSREKCPYIALWSYRMTFPHPRNGKLVSATAIPDGSEQPWVRFQDILQEPIRFS